MIREFTIQRLSAGTFFKLTGLGLAVTFVLVFTVMGCFSFFPKPVLNITWHQHELSGTTVFLLSPFIGLICSAIPTLVIGSCAVSGLWIYSLFKPIRIRAKVSEVDVESYSRVVPKSKYIPLLPQWLRYVLLAIATAGITTSVLYWGTNQFLGLLYADAIATQARVLAGSQQLINEGKIDRANNLLCSMASFNSEKISKLKKIGLEGLFPKKVMESVWHNNLQSIELAQKKLNEMEVRCKPSQDIKH